MNVVTKIFAGIVLVFLIIVGVKFVFGGAKVQTTSTGIVTETFGAGEPRGNQEFIGVLRDLEKVTLDGSIFSSATFQSLHDFSLQLEEEPKGRNNPFKPIDPTERIFAISLSSATGTQDGFSQ